MPGVSCAWRLSSSSQQPLSCCASAAAHLYTPTAMGGSLTSPHTPSTNSSSIQHYNLNLALK